MNFFKRNRRIRSSNLVTVFERQRLSKSMPGQVGASTAARLGGIVI
jgi:hypothetical protein